MIARALAALLLLAFAAASAMACCAHAPVALPEAAGHHHAHDAETHDARTLGDGAAHPHDAAKATCLALAGLAAEPAAEIVSSAFSQRAASFAAPACAEGLSFGPTAPPPKAA